MITFQKPKVWRSDKPNYPMMKMPKSSFIVEDKPKSYITIYIAILLHCSTLKKKKITEGLLSKITLLLEHTLSSYAALSKYGRSDLN